MPPATIERLVEAAPDVRLYTEARVADEHGSDVPTGATGEVVLRGETIMKRCGPESTLTYTARA
ncbi:hypothetical protein DFQ14_102406 [Halopolyspora algeriensis]|uniref:Uncharacterized protein n=1 Tax=Halopolyspora algeriensis TaxID=1500506 RepID=A0A368VVI4_9ACTN|nr:long-chain fatty acid--CoA ligase [Halopolyspora algeriensis]RCW46104.1 hypothetical protein DFQ14_102406 [Halopolyspora algeriensis]